MILAKCENAATYKGWSPVLDQALDLLTPEVLETIGTTTVYMDGDRLYATRQVFESLPEEKTFYESHRRYLDIHVVTKGEERMDIASPNDLRVNEEKSDPEKGDFFVFTGDPDEKQTVILRPGTFLVAFPEDAHRCKGQVEGPCDVEKIVFKIII